MRQYTSRIPSQRWSHLRGIVFTGVNVFLIGHVVFKHSYTIRATVGVSMVPTIAASGDWVLISRAYRRGRNVAVGDIVSFSHPVKVGEGGIKRIVGMPGDFVLRDTPEKGRGMMLQIPEGHCWVAGDNQPDSRDSRLFGPLPLALIKGKVIARVFPFSSMTLFQNTLQEPTVGDEVAGITSSDIV